MIEIIVMDTQQETFAVPYMHFVDGLTASTKSATPVYTSFTAITANLSTQTAALLLGLLLLLIGCLA